MVIITLDARNQPVHWQTVSRVTLPLTQAGQLADRIVLNPGIPPLHSPAFRRWLADWHADHNRP